LRAIQAARRFTWRSGSVVVLALLALILAACSGSRTNDHPTSDASLPGLMPGQVVTTQGAESASLYWPIFLIAVIVFILVEGLVLLVTLKFRRKATDEALPPQTHGNNLLEVVWTAIPFVVVLGLFVWSALIVLPKVTATTENPAVTVDATAFQWQWKFEYPDTGIKPLQGAGKKGPEMVLPVDETIRIRLHATDVIHAFYVPAFFYKLDAIPGRTNQFEVVIEEPGTYGGQCAEFCGLAHADMYFTVRAVERAEYDAWLAQKVAEANATPTPEPPKPSGEPKPPAGETITLLTTAEAPLAFDKQTITAKAGTSVTLEYTNDSGVPHNVAFYLGEDATAPLIARTIDPADALPGPGDVQTLTFDVPAEPGDYYFDCEIHPQQMFGTFEVTP
jgi:cytochrome c oxidase subunit 2